MTSIEQIKQTILEHGYEFKSIIGQGGFSNVFLCSSSKYNQNFAIKQARKEKITKYEFDTLVSLNHPNIIRLYDVFEDDNSQYLVMEYCPNGTILSKGKLTYDQFIYYSKQILDALEYCHSNKIAHRDIKPENILIDNYDNIKLADFGFAKNFEDYTMTDEKCGTIKYFAPEMFLYDKICPFKADIWSLGITFYVMATGKYPFSSYSRTILKQNILYGELDFIENKINQKIQIMINKMTQNNPNLRLSASKLLNLPIYRDFTNNKKVSFHKSFVHNRNKSNYEDEDNNIAPLTKLHSYKSLIHLPGVQKIKGHLMLARI